MVVLVINRIMRMTSTELLVQVWPNESVIGVNTEHNNGVEYLIIRVSYSYPFHK
jgi:hypothetical protein